ncbi:MAG: lytic transglycosylase domain-containing protein [Proteobacteria bacterium]|nr:lytic transglycosylase domain-containing protein [Pseudomonadota bacterium]
MRGGITLPLLGIACLLAAAPAMAGTVFRCDGSDGARSYVSKRIPGASCSPVSRYGAGESPQPRLTPDRVAAGSATLANNVAASPAALASASGTATANLDAAAPVTNDAVPPVTPAKTGAGGPRLVQGQVYSYIQDGVRHYTSKRPGKVANASPVRTIRYSFLETCYACTAKPGVDFSNVRLNVAAYRDEVTAAAAAHGVDEAVVRAIMHAESAFNPNALSRAGAQGLMQLMPATARRFGVTNAFEPAQNIQAGVKYLAWLLKRFNGDVTLAAAGYNAGEGNVDKYKGVPPFDETQRYVQRVGILAERYRGATVAR